MEPVRARPTRAWLALALCVAALVGAAAFASRVQRGFGAIEVTNERYANAHGVPIRAKLLRPRAATAAAPAPGVVFAHGYQSSRETGDSIGIELARRGLVVLAADAIGRGNSGVPGRDPAAADFDPTYGVRATLERLRALPFVDRAAIGMVGHSLGAEMAYGIARHDPDVAALVVIGWGYPADVTRALPRNLLMVFGRYDEFRDRMTGVRHLEPEWLASDRTRAAFPVAPPEVGRTYGDFAAGTARRIALPAVIHVGEPHSAVTVAETVDWLTRALTPGRAPHPEATDQIWPLKEWATLVALLACCAMLLPLAALLLRARPFADLRAAPSGAYACPRGELLRHGAINGLLMLLYLPLTLALFGMHKYVAPVDGVFPMMVTNGIVWWFLWTNLIGFALFRRWYRRRRAAGGPTLAELGISFAPVGLALDRGRLARTALLALALIAAAYGAEHLLERLFLVDLRFVFAFASDLTPRRAGYALLYFPFLLLGFLQLGLFLHGQLRRRPRSSPLRTWADWSLANLAVLLIPLLVLLAMQYVPLLATGAIPFVGPGGMFVLFVINVFHIIGVLILVVPIQTWLFQLTGRPYLGALVSAGLVAWMFASSQVVAPVPI